MFIQTEALPDPNRMKFYPGEAVLRSGMAEFEDEEAAERSPLARRLFEIDGINAVILYDDFLTAIKSGDSEWQVIKPMVLGAIMDHFMSGDPVMDERTAAADDSAEITIEDREEDRQIIEQIHEVLESRIRPAADQMGGDIVYKGFKDNVLYVEFIGPTMALLGGMANILSHFVPEVSAVQDYRDAVPKPGLDTPDGRAVKQVLDERINPAVAGHGGHIALIDVKEDTVFIRLEGGCQGCGMADVTLKQGVEVEIKDAVPNIAHVLDVTDHAGGENPYYAPSK